MEVVWTGFGSLMSGDMRLISFTNLWMFFIYGAAVFLEPIHDAIRGWMMPVRGLIWVIIIWGMEYTSGLLIKTFFGVYAWYYTGYFAIDSLVRIDFAPAWFIAGLLFERLHHTLDAHRVT